jgi:tetratricopeptide (TPR) repeat protein
MQLIQASIQLLDAWMTVRNGFLTKGMQQLQLSLDTFISCHSSWNIILNQMFIAETNRMLGNYDKAKENILAALEAYKEGDFFSTNEMTAIHANCQSILGAIDIELGEMEQARSNLLTSLATHQRLGTDWGTIQPLLGLGKLAYKNGEFIVARDYYLQAMTTAEKIIDHRGMALIHNNLAAVYEVIAQPTESYHHLLTSLQYCRETGDRRLTAVILNNLAYHHFRFLDNYPQAIHTYQESIQLFLDLGDLRGCAYSFYDLSKAYLKVGLLAEAHDYCSRALQTAMTLDSTPMILHALHGFVNLFARTGDLTRALQLCCLVENHPQADADTRNRAIVSRSEIETQLPPGAVASSEHWAESANLQDVIDRLILKNK